jgi:3-hydroxyacyl-CoA dehydrogenase
MGHGVAQACAQAGYKVVGIETAQGAADIGMTRFIPKLNIVTQKLDL